MTYLHFGASGFWGPAILFTPNTLSIRPQCIEIYCLPPAALAAGSKTIGLSEFAERTLVLVPPNYCSEVSAANGVAGPVTPNDHRGPLFNRFLYGYDAEPILHIQEETICTIIWMHNLFSISPRWCMYCQEPTTCRNRATQQHQQKHLQSHGPSKSLQPRLWFGHANSSLLPSQSLIGVKSATSNPYPATRTNTTGATTMTVTTHLHAQTATPHPFSA